VVVAVDRPSVLDLQRLVECAVAGETADLGRRVVVEHARRRTDRRLDRQQQPADHRRGGRSHAQATPDVHPHRVPQSIVGRFVRDDHERAPKARSQAWDRATAL
jgi:hypothetical protein